MEKIYHKNRFYSILRPYVDGLSMTCFGRKKVEGKENIPPNAAIILASNHSQGLMDALIVLALDRRPKVFVARADIFKMKSTQNILRFLKMLPINRLRDGRDSLQQNDAIEEEILSSMQNGLPFGIFPEGTHQSMNSLLPLRKGLFRIALKADQTFGDQLPVCIVPIGISYGHYFRYLSSMHCKVGEAINVSEFVKQNPQMKEVELINALRDMLTQKLKELTLYIPNDENYTGVMELCHIYNQTQLQKLNLDNHYLENRLTSARKTAEEVKKNLEIHPEETQNLIKQAADFFHLRQKEDVSFTSIAANRSMLKIMLRMLFLLVGLPYFLFASLVNFPLVVATFFIIPKVKDEAFFNSIKVVLQAALLPILLLTGMTIVLAVLPLFYGILTLLLFLPSYFFYQRYLRWINILKSDVKWKFNKNLQSEYKRLQHVAAEILNS